MRAIHHAVVDAMGKASSFTMILSVNPTVYAIPREFSLRLQRTSIEKTEDIVRWKVT